MTAQSALSRPTRVILLILLPFGAAFVWAWFTPERRQVLASSHLDVGWQRAGAEGVEVVVGVADGDVGPPDACLTGGGTPEPAGRGCPQPIEARPLGAAGICDSVGYACFGYRVEGPVAAGAMLTVRRRPGSRFAFLVQAVAAGADSSDLVGPVAVEGPVEGVLGDVGPVRITAPADAARIHLLGNLSEALAWSIARHDVWVANGILYLLLMMAAGSVISFFALEKRIDRRLFHGEGFEKQVTALRARIGTLHTRSGTEDERRGIRERLVELAGDPAEQYPSELVDALRAAERHHRASGRLPSEAFPAIADEVEGEYLHHDKGQNGIPAHVLEWSMLLAPTLGFLGTVLGMTKAFGSMGGGGLVGGDVSASMQIAMVTTLAGLCVRVLAVSLAEGHQRSWDATMVRFRRAGMAWCAAFEETVADYRGGQPTGASVPALPHGADRGEA